jgi:type IV pilus assembly protein PilC
MATAEQTINPIEAEQTCFTFQGVDILENPTRKLYIFAADEDEALQRLERAKIQVEAVAEKTEPLRRKRKKLSRDQLGAFAIQLGERTMANESIPSAIQDMGRSSNNLLLREALHDVWQALRDESINIDQALALRADVFPEALRHIIHVGLAKGDPGPMLIKYGRRQQATATNIAKVKGALIYPGVVLSLASIIVWILATFILPQMSQMYDALLQQSGSSLPLLTRILLAGSDFITSYYGIGFILLSIVGIVFLIRWLRSDAGRDWYQRHSIHWPLIGPLIREFNTAHAVDVMAILADAVPPMQFLQEASAASLNVVYRETLDAVRESFRDGGLDLTTAFTPYSYLFGNDFQTAVATGERTGNLADQLSAYAALVDKRVAQSTEKLTKMIEPLTILIAGCTIAFIVVGAYWPLFDLVGKLANKH